ncbi:hypothetical protein GW756_02010 [bacterium]|nr:hypothetical protein [bacterium]NCQ55568.1 hypothetical protein [Candidatus Parcubacteria bacterium]NCS67393.1 hypothetical protein [Candidatus Peregrinibacteria bacterium]NCS96119.1 hypothetical protein [bacterium]
MTFATITSIFKRNQNLPAGVHIEPLHHYNMRQRGQRWRLFHAQPDKVKLATDRLVYFVGAVGPVMTLPQLYTIWIEQNAAGVSIVTWSAYIFTAAFWLTYGILHQQKPIIFTHTCWISIHILMVIGILMYS